MAEHDDPPPEAVDPDPEDSEEYFSGPTYDLDDDDDDHYTSSHTAPAVIPGGGGSGGEEREGGDPQERFQNAEVPGAASHRKAGKDRIWNTSAEEEREGLKGFWLSLGGEGRRSLVKVGKEGVLREMKEQQKHSCSCSVCGRKRAAIREELEVLYDNYFEELEQNANQQHPNYAAQIPHNPPRGVYPTSRIPPLDDALPERDTGPELTFGNSLVVQGGILTVADNLLKDDRKNFIETIEQLAERRMQREEEANAAATGHSDTMTEEQREEEGRRTFQKFAAQMLAQPVLTSYREKVARERQDKLLEELDEEARLGSRREEKKAKKKERNREKKRLRKLAKVEERPKALSNPDGEKDDKPDGGSIKERYKEKKRLQKLAKVEECPRAPSDSGEEKDDKSDCGSIVSQLESIFDTYGSESSASSISQDSVEEQAVHAIASVLANNTDVSAIVTKGVDKLHQYEVDKLMAMALKQFSNDMKQRLENGKSPLGVKIQCLRFLAQNATRIARKVRELTQSRTDSASGNYTALKKHLEEAHRANVSPIRNIELWRADRPDLLDEAQTFRDLGCPGGEPGQSNEADEDEEEDEEFDTLNEIKPDEYVSLGAELLKQLSEFLASDEASSRFVRAVKDKFIKVNNRHALVGDGSLDSLEQYGERSIDTVERNNEREADSSNQNTVKAAPQVCVDQWPALFADGKTDIHFDDGDTWSFSDKIKGSIEDFIGAPVDWWPLSARRRPLREGFSRVRWKCRCGRSMSDVMSAARRDRYEKWRSARSGGLHTEGGGPSTSQGDPGPTATSGSSNDTPSIPPSSSQSTTAASQGGPAVAGDSSNNTPSIPPPLPQNPNGTGQGHTPSGASPPQERQTPMASGLYLFWCMSSGLDQTVVRPIPVAGDDTDEKVFDNLRNMYYRTRGLWRVSLHVVREVRYVKFSNFQHDRVSCYRKQELPEPTNPDYEYRFPGDCDSDIPPIPVDQLVESFRNPSCAGEVRTALESFPKKKNDKTNRIAWGLHACEQISFFRVLVFIGSGLVATLAFVPYWLLDHPGDLQNAFVPAVFFVAFAGLCLGVSVMCTDSRWDSGGGG